MGGKYLSMRYPERQLFCSVQYKKEVFQGFSFLQGVTQGYRKDRRPFSSGSPRVAGYSANRSLKPFPASETSIGKKGLGSVKVQLGGRLPKP